MTSLKDLSPKTVTFEIPGAHALASELRAYPSSLISYGGRGGGEQWSPLLSLMPPDNGITHLITLPLAATSLPRPAMPSSWRGLHSSPVIQVSLLNVWNAGGCGPLECGLGSQPHH